MKDISTWLQYQVRADRDKINARISSHAALSVRSDAARGREPSLQAG